MTLTSGRPALSSLKKCAWHLGLRAGLTTPSWVSRIVQFVLSRSRKHISALQGREGKRGDRYGCKKVRAPRCKANLEWTLVQWAVDGHTSLLCVSFTWRIFVEPCLGP